MADPYDSVLLITFGGPTKREEIRPFLDVVLAGRPIPPERFEQVVLHYEVIGGASPINEITARQAEALRAELMGAGTTLPVYVGMRNWHPFLADVLAKMADNGIRRAVGFILAAHWSEASFQRYTESVNEGLARLANRAPGIDYVDPWFDHPLFIQVLVSRIEEVLPVLPPDRRDGAAWIFSAHSIPSAMAGVDRYQREISRSVELVCARLSRKSWSIAYQSRSGSPRDSWLEPDIGDAIRVETAKGTKDVLVIPVGFVADHVEVLYDLDIQAKEIAESLGLNYVRAKTVGEHPAFIRMMASVVAQNLARNPG
ncbi:MAG: ferrochelatase [Candidatus Tectomicrobia bacterium]|uniref:Ferrochelatase n=1 Tax=Tectimicrobiota bacterium TaxID=2528274 RepID=A0A932GQF0_UNCTE|nr:ferrochelatase [Candidatus Tectomicrobia bacterium]